MALWASFFSRTPTIKPARPSLTFFFFLVGAFLLTMVPHTIELPVWISVLVVIALIIRSFMEVYRVPLPSSTFCGIVALCLACGVLLQFHTPLGRDPGMAFVAGLLAIKFFELRSSRDYVVIIFAGYFVLMSSLLFSQVIELFIYCLIMMWILTALLRRLQIGDLPEDHLLPMLKWSGIIFLQALPLTIFLFFFFPRYQGKLQLNMGESALGFTDTINPGDIASLSQNSSEAFYCRFIDGNIPLVESMYWRGLVLWRYQNGAWKTGDLGDLNLSISEWAVADKGTSVDQEITIYPHYQRWLFALDNPTGPATNPMEPSYWSCLRYGDIIQIADQKTKVDHKERYLVSSSSFVQDRSLTDVEKAAGTKLPDDFDKDDINGEIRALADQLYRDNPTEQGYRTAILHYFRQQHFAYTASPGIHSRGGKWLHEFLFTTKAGFCDHFASAFAVLMRLHNFPTRLVVGYEGADYNPYKNIYSVSQSHAHAWDEVWVNAKVQPQSGNPIGHWKRIDPTAVIPPGEGAQPGSNTTGQQPNGDELSLQAAQHNAGLADSYLPPWAKNSLQEMQMRREQFEADWDDLVFSYDPTAQNRLAEALGLGKNPSFLLGVCCLAIIGLGTLLFQRWLRRKSPLPPVENLYAVFCQDMAQRGIPRASWEGPLAYTGRVAEAFPEKEKAIRDVGSIVAHFRYGPGPLDPAKPEEMKSLLLLITASQAASSSREQS